MKRFSPWSSRIQVGAEPAVAPCVREQEVISRESSARVNGILIGAASGAIGGVLLAIIARGL